jgi:hypothetical protein
VLAYKIKQIKTEKELIMKPVWKWIIGIGLTLLVLGSFATPFIMHSFYGYGTSGYGSGWGMPMMGGFGYGPSGMMGGGFGFLGFGMLFSGFIQLGVLTLIVLGIVWLYREIKKQDQHTN